jgi:hypothetical protein
LNPILSICIPTRNRAETLRLTLENVLSETLAFGPRVEVLVSDNASEDATARVLASFGDRIRYRVREKNVGYFGNMVGLATEMARGRLIWALGDDDMILRGGLARALAQVEAAPEAEVYYLNYGWIPIEERDRVIAREDSRLDPSPEDCNFTLDEARTLPRLEDLALLPNRNSAGILCAMFCYLLPRSFYLEHGHSILSRLWDCYSVDVDDIYPHAKVLMKAFRGRPVRVVAEPCLMQGTGHWEFRQWGVTYKLVPLLQLLDYYATLDLEPAAMARMMEDFEATAGRNFARMLLDPEANQGMESVLEQVFPRMSRSPLFWDRFFKLFRAQETPGAQARLEALLGDRLPLLEAGGLP